MDPTLANAMIMVGRIKNTLSDLETQYPDSLRIKRLHAQLNTVALIADTLLSQSVGTFGGTAGTVHTDTGGTDKPPTH